MRTSVKPVVVAVYVESNEAHEHRAAADAIERGVEAGKRVNVFWSRGSSALFRATVFPDLSVKMGSSIEDPRATAAEAALRALEAVKSTVVNDY